MIILYLLMKSNHVRIRRKRTFQKYTDFILLPRNMLIAAAILVLAGALGIRLIYAVSAVHPGHGDQAFYLTLAQNLASGRGFEIDYVWHFLNPPETITHPANDYWMPLTSIIIAVSLLIFGKSLLASLLPSILFGLMLSVVTYHIGKAWTGSRPVAIISAGMILFVPGLFRYSLLTDSTIFYSVFVSSSLLFMIKGRTNPRFFFLSAIGVALAHLTRQDCIMLVPVLMVAIIISPHHRRLKYKYLSMSLALYALIISPLVINNYTILGSLFPAGPVKTIFLTEYEDIYSYSKDLSLTSYLAWGLPNILHSKLLAGLSNVKTLFRFFGDYLWILVAIGMLELAFSSRIRKNRQIYVLPVLFLLLLFCFYTFIATFPGINGGFYRSAMAIIPFLLVISLDAISRYIPSKTIVYSILIVVAAILSFDSIHSTRKMTNANKELHQQLIQLKNSLSQEASPADKIVVMTRGPWEVHYTTGFKAVQIPNENLATILKVASRYGANYLLLPAPRAAFEDIYSGNRTDPRFEHVASIANSELKLYRIK